jgi:hypothetical protein
MKHLARDDPAGPAAVAAGAACAAGHAGPARAAGAARGATRRRPTPSAADPGRLRGGGRGRAGAGRCPVRPAVRSPGPVLRAGLDAGGADWRDHADTLQTLASMPGERFDVVVTSLGVNDVTSGRSPKRWIAEQARLVAVLRRDFGAPRILMSALPPMHRFPGAATAAAGLPGGAGTALQRGAAGLCRNHRRLHLGIAGSLGGPGAHGARRVSSRSIGLCRLGRAAGALIAVPAAAPERTAGAV